MGWWSCASVLRASALLRLPAFTLPCRVSTSSSSRPFAPSRTFSSTPLVMAALQRSLLFETLLQHNPDSIAVVHSLSGRSFTYGALLHDVAKAKQRLLSKTGKDDKSIVGERIAFLIENSYDYVGMLLFPSHWVSQNSI